MRILVIEDVKRELQRIVAMLHTEYPTVEVVQLQSAEEVERWLAGFLLAGARDAPVAVVLDIMLPFSLDRDSDVVPDADFDHHTAGVRLLGKLRDIPALANTFVAFHTVVGNEDGAMLKPELARDGRNIVHVHKEIGLDGLRRALRQAFR